MASFGCYHVGSGTRAYNREIIYRNLVSNFLMECKRLGGGFCIPSDTVFNIYAFIAP